MAAGRKKIYKRKWNMWPKIISFYVLLSVICPLPTAFCQATESGLAIPRFVSLKAKTANLRVGPGADYPIIWLLTCQGYPLEIIAEFDHWRKVRDCEGSEGWIHKAMLSGQRNVLMKEPQVTIYRHPQCQSKAIAYAEKNVVAELIKCQDDWCRVNVGGQRGWVERKNLWGVYPDEILK